MGKVVEWETTPTQLPKKGKEKVIKEKKETPGIYPGVPLN